MTRTDAPPLAMTVLRGAIFVALAFVGRRAIVDAVEGHPSAGGLIVIGLMVGLAAWIVWGVWRRFA